MKIIGLNAFGQNPSACLLIDNELKGFSHEERFNRQKCSHGLFPINTIKWLLKSNNLNLSDIDYIAYNWDCGKYPNREFFNLVTQRIKVEFSLFKKPRIKYKSQNNGSVIDYLRFYSPNNIRPKIQDELTILGHGSIPKIEFIDHHLCHAYQTYCHSPFSDAIVLVADGHGEENTISGYNVVNSEFKKIIDYKIPFSLGWFFAGMTSYLGFNANRDEGKLMGLAAYGESRKDINPWLDHFNEIISVSNKKLLINPYFFKIGSHNNSPYYSDYLIDYITSKDKGLLPIKYFSDGSRYLSKNYIDLAYATQYKLEEALIFIVKELVHKTNQKKLCIAGGLGLNCKANKSIFKECGLDDIFIHPASSDDGSSIGAAFYLSSQFNGLYKSPINNTYYGASFSNDEIEDILKNCGIKYAKPQDTCKETAKLLNNNQIIGWFQGGAEMGARALGGRSIIANPFEEKIKDKINKEVKYRETWRPYCPSILDDFSDKYLKDSLNGKYMILACEAQKELKEKAPAVVHIDNTVRPQCVKKEDTPKWHGLLSEFNILSDIPVLLNTSFNVRGEPIVNSPYDAIKTFYSTGLNSLVLGDFLISK